MADQWEYFMVVLSYISVKGRGNTSSHYMIQRLTADGQPSTNFVDAPSMLAELGTAGWELVTAGSSVAEQQVLIFKRRKP
jgi:hypothetical protein